MAAGDPARLGGRLGGRWPRTFDRFDKFVRLRNETTGDAA